MQQQCFQTLGALLVTQFKQGINECFDTEITSILVLCHCKLIQLINFYLLTYILLYILHNLCSDNYTLAFWKYIYQTCVDIFILYETHSDPYYPEHSLQWMQQQQQHNTTTKYKRAPFMNFLLLRARFLIQINIKWY